MSMDRGMQASNPMTASSFRRTALCLGDSAEIRRTAFRRARKSSSPPSTSGPTIHTNIMMMSPLVHSWSLRSKTRLVHERSTQQRPHDRYTKFFFSGMPIASTWLYLHIGTKRFSVHTQDGAIPGADIDVPPAGCSHCQVGFRHVQSAERLSGFAHGSFLSTQVDGEFLVHTHTNWITQAGSFQSLAGSSSQLGPSGGRSLGPRPGPLGSRIGSGSLPGLIQFGIHGFLPCRPSGSTTATGSFSTYANRLIPPFSPAGSDCTNLFNCAS